MPATGKTLPSDRTHPCKVTYVGDIGDNTESRSNVDIYRVAEPDVTMGYQRPRHYQSRSLRPFLSRSRTMQRHSLSIRKTVMCSSSPRQQRSFPGVSRCCTACRCCGKVTTMTQVAVLKFVRLHFLAIDFATGGDISPMGDEIAIRSYDSRVLWRRPKGMSIADALSQTPCSIPLASEPQGSAWLYKTGLDTIL